MNDNIVLLENLDKLHTTELGAERIKKNLKATPYKARLTTLYVINLYPKGTSFGYCFPSYYTEIPCRTWSLPVGIAVSFINGTSLTPSTLSKWKSGSSSGCVITSPASVISDVVMSDG